MGIPFFQFCFQFSNSKLQTNYSYIHIEGKLTQKKKKGNKIQEIHLLPFLGEDEKNNQGKCWGSRQLKSNPRNEQHFKKILRTNFRGLNQNSCYGKIRENLERKPTWKNSRVI